MGSSTTPQTIKKLGQFLEEQQEPFILEIYLSERGCKNKKKLNSGKFLNLKRSVSINNSIKAAYNKLASIKDSPKIKNHNHSQEVAEADRFSSACSTTITTEFNLQKADLFQFTENEAAADRKIEWNCLEESEQISPVSVLQQENQSRSSITMAKQITEDSLPSDYFWAKEELPNSEFYKSKKILQQTKQLLFDCVREVLKTHDENGKGRRRQLQSCKELMGPELLGKLMSDKIKAWGKESGDELNITRLLDFDFQDSVKEWTDHQPQMKDVAFEIGDAILEDIRDQIVTDMVSM